LYLAREAARRSKDAHDFNALVRTLVTRCVAMVRAGISDRLRYADDARNEIIDQLMDLIAIDGSPEGKNLLDYFEVNFDHGLKTLRVNVVRAHRALAAKEIPASDVAAQSDDDEAALTEERLASLEEKLETLTPRERTAISLHYLQGIDIESNNPTKTTVAKLMGISGRTVRTVLSRARQQLLTLEKKP
jgi:RNA polymerase sigma factor (sigma-70 family)